MLHDFDSLTNVYIIKIYILHVLEKKSAKSGIKGKKHELRVKFESSKEKAPRNFRIVKANFLPRLSHLSISFAPSRCVLSSLAPGRPLPVLELSMAVGAGSRIGV